MLRSERVGRLGLLDDRDRPRVLPVTFALAGELVYSAVDRYHDDWSALAWVQLLCTVELLDPEDDPVGIEALAARYEQYRREPPAGPLLRLVPQRALHWRASDRG